MMNRAQLKEKAKSLGIRGYSRMTVTALSAAIEAMKVSAADRVGYKIEKDRPCKNGVTRPSAGGRMRAIYDLCDELATSLGRTPKLSEILSAGQDRGFNKNNTDQTYYDWRKFNGIVGRI